VTLVLDTSATKAPAAPVTISVNGVAIARDAIVREMQYHPAEKSFAAWQQAARALVIRELLLQEARRAGIVPQPMSDSCGRCESGEEAMIRGLIEREVSVPEPDDENCRRYYDRNRTRFRSPDMYEAFHILFAALPADREARERARADAVAVLAELSEHPERFAELARMHSRCPSAAQGGNLGQITTGQTTPEFEQALAGIAPGQLCEAPVATRYGFHIIRLDRKHEGQILPYKAVACRIADYLRESVRRRADAQYIARLVTAARIEGIELAGADALRVH
jgi:peptidyl-prolyl cis-trans isomerase C